MLKRIHRIALQATLVSLSLVAAACVFETGGGEQPSTSSPGGHDVLAGLSAGSWVDLTHSLNAQTPFWPTSREFEKTVVFEGQSEAGFYYTAYDISVSEHGGTHLDAPIHFAENRDTTDRIPLDRLIGPAVVIDLSTRVGDDADYQIKVSDLEGWELEHGAIAEGSIVLLNTGWARFYPDHEAYMGTAERGPAAVAKLHFPGIHPDAARWLAEERTVNAVGIDTPSIDFGQSTDFLSHQILYQQNIPGFENVANLDGLPATGALVVALPTKIEGGSGGPLRIVAWVTRGSDDG